LEPGVFRPSLLSTCLAFAALRAPAASAAPLHADDAALAYFGDFLVHPGVSGRLGWQLNASPRTQVLLEAQLGGYWHRNNMVAVHARTGPAVRWTDQGGTSLGAFVHLGAQQGFWATPTYTVDDGEVHKAPLAGDQWVVVVMGGDVGHRLRSAALDAWFIRPQVALRAPTFHRYGVDLVIEGGVRF
jgi:hypothetical protein